MRLVRSVKVRVLVCRSVGRMAAKHPEDAKLPFSFMEEDSEEENGVYGDPDVDTPLFEDELAADDSVIIGADPMIGGGVNSTGVYAGASADRRRVKRRESSPIQKLEVGINLLPFTKFSEIKLFNNIGWIPYSGVPRDPKNGHYQKPFFIHISM